MKKFSTAVFFFLMSSALGSNLNPKNKASGSASSAKAPVTVLAPPAMQRLTPRARIEALPASTSPTFIAKNFLSKGPQLLFLNSHDITLAPRITAMQTGQSLGAENQTVFAVGKLNQGSKFDVVRNWQKIIDPVSGQFLGIAGKRVGKVELTQAAGFNSPYHQFLVTHAWSELSVGDLLLPAISDDRSPVEFDMQAPKSTTTGRVATLMREGLWAGTMDILAINLGIQHGIHPGATLSVLKQAKIDYSSALETTSQPFMQSIATLFVFDVNELASFVFVMQASDVISVGDSIGSIRTIGK